MNEQERNKIEEEIKNASPLELVSKLQEAELFDEKDTKQVIDEIYQEFESKENAFEKLAVPVFTTVVDGFLECTSATRKLRKKGLNATRIVTECRNFSYDNPGNCYMVPDGYTEYKNIRETTEEDFAVYGESVRVPFDRSQYEDKAKLQEYKDDVFEKNGGRINATDEYSLKNNVYQDSAHPDLRRNVERYKHDHRAEVDHIVPLKQVYENLKGNYALTEEDIKNIANQDTNYALTSAAINRGAGHPGEGGKFDMTNEEFVADQRRRMANGEPNLGLSEEALKNILDKDKQAKSAMEQDVNKTILTNITGQGTADASQIWDKAVGNAAKQAKEYMIGNVILFIIKPLYYELSDIFVNGLKGGVNAGTNSEAFRIRFGRIKEYMKVNFLHFMGNSVWDFVKGLVSSLIEGIISLFLGIFKQIFKLVKEGIRIFTQSVKVLFGEISKKMSPAEKGDAIIKIIGGGVISICGIGVEALLNKIGIPDPWSIVVSTIISGLASVLFMYALDRLDLFSVKAEKRYARIEDVFNERINDIKEAEATYNSAAKETMRQQYLNFCSIKEDIQSGIDSNNIDGINCALYRMSAFFRVELPYYDTATFVEWSDSDGTLSL